MFRINRVTSERKQIGQKSTDASGEFQFENVVDIAKEYPGGKIPPSSPLETEFIQIYVRAPGHATEMRFELRQRVAKWGGLFDIKLPPAATLTGRVTGPDGKSILGALVSLGGTGYMLWEGARSTRTYAEGRYEIKDAAPFDMQKFREQQADQRRKLEAFRSNATKEGACSLVAPPVLVVEHPDFAATFESINAIPGTRDVKLERAAIIDGRVVYAHSGKTAAGAIVHVARVRTSLPAQEPEFSAYTADARTDADGKYRFTMLPSGNYDLSAEMPGWVNVGIEGFAAARGKASTAPDLVLSKGGIISIRLVDAKTSKPIKISPDMRADIHAHLFPFRSYSRPAWEPNAKPDSEGRFELRTAHRQANRLCGARDGWGRENVGRQNLARRNQTDNCRRQGGRNHSSGYAGRKHKEFAVDWHFGNRASASAETRAREED